MALNFYWQDDTKKIFRCDIIGEWTWAEYDAAVERACETIREVTHDVSIITDITQSARMPKGSPMQHLRYTRSILPLNVRTMISVGKYSMFTNAIMNAFLKVYSQKRIKMMMASNLAEAQKLLETESVS